MATWMGPDEIALTAKPWNPNASHCEIKHVWDLPGGVELYEPSMVLCAGLGIATGVTGLVTILRRGRDDAHLMYALTFLTFACMNTTGLVNWCLFDNESFMTASLVHKWILLLDGVFSSTTSLNFFWCALSDLGILRLTRGEGRLVVVAAFAGIFYGYYMAMFHGWSWAWSLLYMDLTRYGSSSFFVITLARMAFTCNCKGLGQLVAAIVIGLSGLDLLLMPKAQRFLCHWMNGYFTGMDVWYIQSDLSLIFLLGFFLQHSASSLSGSAARHDDLKAPLLV